MNPAELAKRVAALDWSATSLQHQLAVCAAVETLKGLEVMQTNVVTLPARSRTRWTQICQLDGREWASTIDGAWGWIVETIAAEHCVHEDRIGSLESGEDAPYDCDDLVTIDGLPAYRIQHSC
jgi:hypothetical protein